MRPRAWLARMRLAEALREYWLRPERRERWRWRKARPAFLKMVRKRAHLGQFWMQLELVRALCGFLRLRADGRPWARRPERWREPTLLPGLGKPLEQPGWPGLWGQPGRRVWRLWMGRKELAEQPGSHHRRAFSVWACRAGGRRGLFRLWRRGRL